MSKIIFISYARLDVEFAKRVNADLRYRNLTTWIDELGIRGGDDWPERIALAIEQCTAVLAILSPSAFQSKWVRRELEFADKRGKSIIPIVFQTHELPPTFELRFGHLQRI